MSVENKTSGTKVPNKKCVIDKAQLKASKAEKNHLLKTKTVVNK